MLRFEGPADEWFQEIAGKKDGPCEASVVPNSSGGFEVRLSYLRPKSGPQELRTLVFETSTQLVVDHWFDVSVAAGMKPVKSKAGKAKVEPTTAAAAQAPPFLNAFSEKTSWESILGAEARPLDLNSSELDRFRGFDREQNIGLEKLPMPKRKLRVPMLRFLPMDRPLDFVAPTFVIPEFRAPTASPRKELQAALDGMNFVASLVREGKWLKARDAVEVLLKSKYAHEVPTQDSRWWALRGYIYAKAGDEFLSAPASETIKEPDGRVITKHDLGRMLIREALILWSDGLRKSAGIGGGHQEHVEYMALESARRLFDGNLYYGAASLLGWLIKFSWPDRIEERFHYLYAEAFLHLGMYEEARDLFRRYFNERKSIPVSGRIDRRLVPSAAFRLGDIEYRLGDFEAALKAYGFAFAETLGPGKFNFEGAWYPDEVRYFPTVFLNRAGSALRLGLYRNALNDLRAFLYVAPNDADVGLAYYMIGDLLERLGVEAVKVEGAWKECAFKVPDSLGARLCQARQAARDIASQPKERWPRFIGLIEDAYAARQKVAPRALHGQDLDFFANLLVSYAFLEANEPGQSLLRLETIDRFEASEYLREWYREYLITAFAGVQSLRLADGRNRDAVAEYEKRRLTTFLGSDRPQILFQVAAAFAASGLWSEARNAFNAADKLKTAFKDAEKRPFDYDDEKVRYLRAQIWVGSVEKEASFAPAARKSLEALDRKETPALRLWMSFARATANGPLELQIWRELAGREALGWDEVVQYESALAKQKREAERRELLEQRVGAWFAERERKGEKSAPPRELLVKLAESRGASRASATSLVVWEHLIATAAAAEEKSLASYRKGEVLKRLGRTPEARQSFESARTLAPESIWGQLSAAALRDLPDADPSK